MGFDLFGWLGADTTRLGILAQATDTYFSFLQTKSRPMKEILSRIVSLGFFNITIFSDDVIKNEPIENWPLCDCLISFFSSGFPLEKAIAYANLRKPLLLNDLEMQFNLHDR